MQRRTLRAALMTAAALITVAILPAPAQASPWVGVWIESQLSGTCVSVPSAVDGVSATQEICEDLGTQLWTFEDVTSGRYRIRSLGTGKCLTGVGTTTGAPVQQFACGSGTDQQWTLTGSGNTFRIVNVTSGKCLARPGKDPGTQLVQGTCLISLAQWQLLF